MYSMNKTTYLLAILGIFSILSYQNCSQELGSLGGKINKASDGIPFPVDVDIDTLAYMSCIKRRASDALDGGGYFSYKATFHSPGLSSGIKRSTEFDDFVDSKGGSSDENRLKYLKKSTKIDNVKLQFSLKIPGNMATNDDGFTDTFSHVSLKDPSLISNLVYFDVPISLLPEYMEASIDLRQADLTEDTDLHNIDFMGKHLTLTVDYIKLNAPELSIGPYTYGESENTNLIYGNKYKVYFTAEQSNREPQKRIASIAEYNAATNVARANVFWDCSKKYMIVRPGDTPACITGSGVSINGSGTADDQKLFKLLGSGWVRYGDCIRPTSTSAKGCYGESASAADIPVAYNGSQQCNDANGPSLCANYLSVCTKNGGF